VKKEKAFHTPTNFAKTPKYKQTPVRTKRQWNAIERAVNKFSKNYF